MERERRRDLSRESQTLRAMFPTPVRSSHEEDEPETLRIGTPGLPSRPVDRLPALTPARTDASERMLIVPARPQTRTLSRLPAGQRRRRSLAGFSRQITFVAVLIALVGALGYQVILTTRQPSSAAAIIPAPSGRGPWTASSGALMVISTVAPVTQSTTDVPAALQPCHDSTMFVPNITQWSVPPGCYGTIYQPNPANYVQRPGFGWCNWWVRVTHPAHPDITESLAYTRGTNPVAGAPIFFDGNEQGADSEGHWAVAVAIAPDHYWVLISEMNFAWRGAGWGKIDYRYIHVSPHVHFVYIFS